MPNKIRPVIELGIYFDLDEQLYHDAEGLSCSGIKHLTVSKLNYWHKNLNPNREPEEDTGARGGSARPSTQASPWSQSGSRAISPYEAIPRGLPRCAWLRRTT